MTGLRYLKKNTEETGNSWSEETAALVREMNRERKALLEKGITVKIGGDTSGLEKSLSAVNNSIKKIQS